MSKHPHLHSTSKTSSRRSKATKLIKPQSRGRKSRDRVCTKPPCPPDLVRTIEVWRCQTSDTRAKDKLILYRKFLEGVAADSVDPDGYMYDSSNGLLGAYPGTNVTSHPPQHYHHSYSDQQRSIAQTSDYALPAERLGAYGDRTDAVGYSNHSLGRTSAYVSNTASPSQSIANPAIDQLGQLLPGTHTSATHSGIGGVRSTPYFQSSSEALSWQHLSPSHQPTYTQNHVTQQPAITREFSVASATQPTSIAVHDSSSLHAFTAPNCYPTHSSAKQSTSNPSVPQPNPLSDNSDTPVLSSHIADESVQTLMSALLQLSPEEMQAAISSFSIAGRPMGPHGHEQVHRETKIDSDPRKHVNSVGPDPTISRSGNIADLPTPMDHLPQAFNSSHFPYSASSFPSHAAPRGTASRDQYSPNDFDLDWLVRNEPKSEDRRAPRQMPCHHAHCGPSSAVVGRRHSPFTDNARGPRPSAPRDRFRPYTNTQRVAQHRRSPSLSGISDMQTQIAKLSRRLDAFIDVVGHCEESPLSVSIPRSMAALENHIDEDFHDFDYRDYN
ncbi:hypothetical protein SISSUDRAFT_1066840 [Sistotremastrum suecicum HHB10207 ss-3]|uniref:Uncharacterized protein n=1 Tax=Sistotremastrum suecicum HHB10207 ss-3 TaxID=1314776 RepID=A0A165XU67_9AGAM|nr:hypothetical protein SISSUDRAFT_1066840 [Sistotremastrum suecicum HHB10207 ss-3]